VNQPAVGPSRRRAWIAFAVLVGLALLLGGWIGHGSSEESWEQHLYTLFFVKVAAGACVVLGLLFLFFRTKRVLSVAFLIAAAAFWFAFQAFSSTKTGDATRRSSLESDDRSSDRSL
jgi:hypothetical protein